jgi:hypothetical protein
VRVCLALITDLGGSFKLPVEGRGLELEKVPRSQDQWPDRQEGFLSLSSIDQWAKKDPQTRGLGSL